MFLFNYQIYIKKVYDYIISFNALIFRIFAPQNLDINELRFCRKPYQILWCQGFV